MKALNNYIAAAGYTAVVESLLIGERFGLDQGTMVDILNASTGRNFTTEVMIKEQVLGGKFATGFALGLMAKDVRIAADLGEAVKLDAPVSRLIRERWALARERLGATRDTSEAILVGRMTCRSRASNFGIGYWASVKIVRGDFGARDLQRPDAFRLHRHHIVLILKRAFDQQKGMMDDHGVIALE